ncbi:uncharacterized protein LOC135809276 [Sycon ciliatum]|uniref:uncharacterized protein LOC135809276 n=1 Tax=Sycon ciliatum TaxID=27933 RepID=UPI0031F6C1E9
MLERLILITASMSQVRCIHGATAFVLLVHIHVAWTVSTAVDRSVSEEAAARGGSPQKLMQPAAIQRHIASAAEPSEASLKLSPSLDDLILLVALSSAAPARDQAYLKRAVRRSKADDTWQRMLKFYTGHSVLPRRSRSRRRMSAAVASRTQIQHPQQSGTAWSVPRTRRQFHSRAALATNSAIGGKLQCTLSSHAVFGEDVSTFGPLLGCVQGVIRCIEKKRDQCLNRAVTSGDLAMYCPRLSAEEKGDCVESFLRTRCSAFANQCLRDCRGISRSRNTYNEECRIRHDGQVCHRYTKFHQQRINTQSICVPRRCDTRVVSESLARYYGLLRREHTSQSRSLTADALDDLVVCGGRPGNPRHASSGNRAIDIHQHTSLGHGSFSSTQNNPATVSNSSASRTKLSLLCYVVTLVVLALFRLVVLC